VTEALDDLLAAAAPGLLSTPDVAGTAYIAPGAVLLGDVTVAEHASVWFGAVLRGDQNAIRIGAGSNVQDNCVLHADHPDFPGTPVLLGADVTVGHNCVVHGCGVGDGALIGSGSVVLDGVVIGERALVAAGSVVLPGTELPAEHLIAGSPAKVKRPLTEDEVAGLARPARIYRRLAGAHRRAAARTEETR
jgi:carbonic anhydrase/acetyltransferase-like protein (isoleucine patch superfamily)